MRYTDNFLTAFNLVSIELEDDGGMGRLFLIVMFVFGLAASFSIARK